MFMFRKQIQTYWSHRPEIFIEINNRERVDREGGGKEKKRQIQREEEKEKEGLFMFMFRKQLQTYWSHRAEIFIEVIKER